MDIYHKIQTVFLRNTEDNFKSLLEGQFAKPEFEFLANNQWDWTEKVDGMNIRVMFNGEKVYLAGKTGKNSFDAERRLAQTQNRII
jgi:hypothetical protein